MNSSIFHRREGVELLWVGSLFNPLERVHLSVHHRFGGLTHESLDEGVGKCTPPTADSKDISGSFDSDLRIA